jgi:hypothetical protein
MNGTVKLLQYAANAARRMTAPPRMLFHLSDDGLAPAALVGLSAVVPPDMPQS